MILKKKIPRDFYKLFRTQNMEYYMQLLTALYEADQEAYALTQLTDSECRSILAETIARVNLVWWEDETEKTVLRLRYIHWLRAFALRCFGQVCEVGLAFEGF